MLKVHENTVRGGQAEESGTDEHSVFDFAVNPKHFIRRQKHADNETDRDWHMQPRAAMFKAYPEWPQDNQKDKFQHKRTIQLLVLLLLRFLWDLFLFYILFSHKHDYSTDITLGDALSW